MSFREQMSQMRREYRKEADRLDQKIDHLADRMDHGLGVVQERLGRAETAIATGGTAIARLEESVRIVHLQWQNTRDELAATNEAVGKVREDLQETAYTMKGRVRLVEDRFGKMLEMVEKKVDNAPTLDRIERIEERLLALEAKNDPAA